MSTQTTMFRTAGGQARYFAAYDATLALWPVPVRSIDLPTRFGSTHVLACGPEDALPLVLVPGQAVSATMWYPNIGALSQAHRVYAVDILGDMGKSTSTRAWSKPADFAEWLSELLDQLQIEQTAVAGLSYGGFIALRLALGAPERVTRLVMLAPASLLPLRPLFFARMAAMLLPASVLPLPSKQRLLLGTYAPAAGPVIRQMMTTADFRYQMYLPPVARDDELRQLRVRTLLLLGEREVIYSPQAALKRACRLIPHLETAIIPEAGHALTWDQPELVNQRILAFLAGTPRG